ncbi:MAG: DUF3307 domain-containing protein [Lachnotalea sp.]
MFREYFFLLLLGHILGEFYIQTRKMAEKKEKSIKWVLIHCLCYCGIMILLCAPIMSSEIALAVTMASLLHLIIDLVKFTYLLSIAKKDKLTQVIERNVFFVD